MFLSLQSKIYWRDGLYKYSPKKILYSFCSLYGIYKFKIKQPQLWLRNEKQILPYKTSQIHPEKGKSHFFTNMASLREQSVLHFTITIWSSTMRITYALTWMSNISCSRTVLFISVVKHYIMVSLSFGRHLVYNMLFPDVQGDQENKIWVKQIPLKLTILSPFIQVAVHVRKVCICVLGYQFRNCSIYYRSELVVSTVPVLYIEPFSF